jgi:hypothetical protein
VAAVPLDRLKTVEDDGESLGTGDKLEEDAEFAVEAMHRRNIVPNERLLRHR